MRGRQRVPARDQADRKDGSTVRYLQLAHNYRDPDTGHAIAKILYSFGRADLVDRTALERLVGSVSRFLDQQPPTSEQSGEVEPVDGRDLGGAWVLDQLWGRLGIGKAIVKVARGRKLDAKEVERALFALVASRALAPSSKLEATRWVIHPGFCGGSVHWIPTGWLVSVC